MIRKIKIFELIEISKIIDKLSILEMSVSDAFEVYHFKDNMNKIFSFLNDITSDINLNDFNKISQEKIYFNIPMISIEDILNKYHLDLTKEQIEIINRFLLP